MCGCSQKVRATTEILIETLLQTRSYDKELSRFDGITLGGSQFDSFRQMSIKESRLLSSAKPAFDSSATSLSSPIRSLHE
jgi:hypothetical protein